VVFGAAPLLLAFWLVCAVYFAARRDAAFTGLHLLAIAEAGARQVAAMKQQIQSPVLVEIFPGHATAIHRWKIGTELNEASPAIVVIFGGAGDLAWRKLIPSLFDLHRAHLCI
jgi:hypothetical protein